MYISVGYIGFHLADIYLYGNDKMKVVEFLGEYSPQQEVYYEKINKDILKSHIEELVEYYYDVM